VVQVVPRLVVDHEGAVGVVNHGVRRDNGVVRLDSRGGDRRSRLGGEL
jgi:hypothetical protein